MKKISSLFMFSIALLLVSARGFDFQYDRTVTKVKAKVHFMDNGQLCVLIPDDNANQRFIADNMPDEFKKDDLQVTFTGDVGKIPPNVRMMGTPLHLKCICVTGAEKKKHSLKKKKYSFK